MAMAASYKVVLGSIAFAVFWVLAVFPAVPFLPVGRTAGSLLGAVLMNLVIAVQSKISFGDFVIGILPAMLVGVSVNALILLVMYWRSSSVQRDEEDGTTEVAAEVDVSPHRFSPATMSHLSSLNFEEFMDPLSSPSHTNGSSTHVDALRNRVNSVDQHEIQRSPQEFGCFKGVG
ncbi:Divalent ion symporter isoform 1 [Hibiscus syriacus]|uniref:Divalent ion symporter isoform 1 n=1 Tax=Hibiscus syriacus TaxID=106335 RepID=A0A6A3C4B9_HIBSY|nr:Divalent ion symporter isoform 1 [Hibiscus syriacus]